MDFNNFLKGFYKRADSTSGLTGGSGFTGEGKGAIRSGTLWDRVQGDVDDQEVRKGHDLLDRDRTARDFSLHNFGPELRDESNPHIRY